MICDMTVGKSTLSVYVLALIAVGVSARVILGQFLYEKEANRLTAYRDSKGLWTICKGLTTLAGQTHTGRAARHS